MTSVAVLGATGFVGSAVTSHLRQCGADVRIIRAPRLVAGGTSAEAIIEEASEYDGIVQDLTRFLRGVHCVVNAAALADATGPAWRALCGANALLPLLVQRACRRAGVERLVHVSSAAVQGRVARLDESPNLFPFSAYSRSKALGEECLRRLGSRPHTVLFRPTSVHGPDRSMTRSLARFAASGLASVAGTGRNPTPQVLLGNVSAAIGYLAVCPESPPEIVLQPSEGLTTAGLLRVLGGKEPRHVPTALARSLVDTAGGIGARSSRVAGQARRLEMVWFGQAQVEGWLAGKGWRAPLGAQAWQELAGAVRTEDRRGTSA